MTIRWFFDEDSLFRGILSLREVEEDLLPFFLYHHIVNKKEPFPEMPVFFKSDPLSGCHTVIFHVKHVYHGSAVIENVELVAWNSQTVEIFPFGQPVGLVVKKVIDQVPVGHGVVTLYAFAAREDIPYNQVI